MPDPNSDPSAGVDYHDRGMTDSTRPVSLSDLIDFDDDQTDVDPGPSSVSAE